MRWPEERYVRVYTRDTLTLKRLGWKGRAVLWELFRKVDRAGYLEIGLFEPAAALATVLDIPRDLANEAWPALIESGTVVLADRSIFIPNFVQAQETRASDAQRKREQRGRDRDLSAAEASRNVTGGHTESLRAVPCRAVPCHTTPKEQKRDAQSPEKPAPAPAADLDLARMSFVEILTAVWPDIRDPAGFERRAQAAFPGVSLAAEARRACGWEFANPRKKKSNHGKFLWDWLTREQDNPRRNGAATFSGERSGGAHLRVDNDAHHALPTGKVLV